MNPTAARAMELNRHLDELAAGVATDPEIDTRLAAIAADVGRLETQTPRAAPGAGGQTAEDLRRWEDKLAILRAACVLPADLLPHPAPAELEPLRRYAGQALDPALLAAFESSIASLGQAATQAGNRTQQLQREAVACQGRAQTLEQLAGLIELMAPDGRRVAV